MEKNKTPIAVLGAGAWGMALAILLARNGQTVHVWDQNTDHLLKMQHERSCLDVALPDNLLIHTTIDAAVRDVNDICLVIPSHAFRSVLMTLKPLVPETVRFVWGTKGLDPIHHAFLHTVVFDVFSKQTPIAVLSGPSFAKEVMRNVPTAVSLAGNNPDFLDSLIDRFQTDYFSLQVSADLIGVQLCAVAKNVMAIATGMVDGLGFGTNTQCALMTYGLAEIKKLCLALGGDAETVMSLAGVGDLILTCSDNQSRNRRFGLSVGQGHAADQSLKQIGQSVEGYYNAKQLYELAKENRVEMPIASRVYSILYENQPVKSILKTINPSS